MRFAGRRQSQIFAAATFPDQIPDAARWPDQHHYLTSDALAHVISDDHLPWDPSSGDDGLGYSLDHTTRERFSGSTAGSDACGSTPAPRVRSPRPGFFIGGAISFRFGYYDRRRICALGLGREPFWAGRAPGVYQ